LGSFPWQNDKFHSMAQILLVVENWSPLCSLVGHISMQRVSLSPQTINTADQLPDLCRDLACI